MTLYFLQLVETWTSTKRKDLYSLEVSGFKDPTPKVSQLERLKDDEKGGERSMYETESRKRTRQGRRIL